MYGTNGPQNTGPSDHKNIKLAHADICLCDQLTYFCSVGLLLTSADAAMTRFC